MTYFGYGWLVDAVDVRLRSGFYLRIECIIAGYTVEQWLKHDQKHGYYYGNIWFQPSFIHHQKLFGNNNTHSVIPKSTLGEIGIFSSSCTRCCF